MRFDDDKRVVMTLDAGGTNLVFSAICGNKEVVEPVRLPSDGKNLDKCLANIVEGFKQVEAKLSEKPVAISFAFPGPADYPNGIIGDLGNLPAFRGGVALGPMLEEEFGVPVYINNDGDLFSYGEAIAGLLPKVNDMLKKAGSPKRYRNLVGITLGTGFGVGIVHEGKLYIGDNSAGAEGWLLRNKVYPKCIAEEGISIRAIQGEYARLSVTALDEGLTPKDIYDIATGVKAGDVEAAKKAFGVMAEVLGDALANIVTLLDGLVVIGGGLSGAKELFMPAVVAEMNGTIEKLDGTVLPRLCLKVFNLEDESQLGELVSGDVREVKVPGSDKTVAYDPMKRTGVGISVLGASEAMAIGAYAFALDAIDSAS